MLTVISPAKTLDFDTPPITRRATQPRFLERAAQLVEDARALSPDDLRRLMGVSGELADLNHRRFRQWQLPATRDNARQAILAFRGDVYTGLDADSLTAEQLGFAQRHLRILSGLYGLLRPLDLIQPYRLEMGLKFANRGGANLYRFWGDSVATELNRQLQRSGTRVLVNLASNEYFRVLEGGRLAASVVTPVFLDRKNGEYKLISFFAKRARGRMARFIIDRALDDPADLVHFRADGYRYDRARSSTLAPVFTREPVAA